MAASHAPDEDPRPTIHRDLSEIAAAAKALLDDTADLSFEPERVLTLSDWLKPVQRRYQHRLMSLRMALVPPGPLPWARNAQSEHIEATPPEGAP
jgi:hypothetical protein